MQEVPRKLPAAAGHQRAIGGWRELCRCARLFRHSRADDTTVSTAPATARPAQLLRDEDTGRALAVDA